MYKLKTPQAPLALTTTSIIPFVASAGAMYVWRGDTALQQTAGLWLIVYGAVVMSFLGGVRWGAEMTRRDKPRFGELLSSIFGVLIGWTLVIAYFQWRPDKILFLAMAAALILHYVLDVMSGEMPIWYRRLRVWPTLGAVLSLAVAYWLFGRA